MVLTKTDEYFSKNVFERLLEKKSTAISRDATKTQNSDVQSLKKKSWISTYKSPVMYGTLGMQLYGIQVVSPKTILIFRNADCTHRGKQFLIPESFTSLKVFLRLVSEKLSLFGGPCRALYNREFVKITSMDQLIDQEYYLATSGENPIEIEQFRRSAYFTT